MKHLVVLVCLENWDKISDNGLLVGLLLGSWKGGR